MLLIILCSLLLGHVENAADAFKQTAQRQTGRVDAAPLDYG